MSSGIELALSMAQSSLSYKRPLLPWELGHMRGVFVREHETFGRVLVSPVIPPVPEPSLPPGKEFVPVVPRAKVCARKRPQLFAGRMAKKLRDNRVIAEQDPCRTRALEVFKDLLACGPSEFREGRLLIDMADYGTDCEMKHLQTIFVRKATSTLTKRASAWTLFVSWQSKSYPKCHLFPLQEHWVFEYFNHVILEKRSSTRCHDFLSAVRFVQHTLGLDDAEVVLSSGRVRGLADMAALDRPPVVQKPPLTVNAILLLEDALFDDDLQTASMSGFILCLIFARARHSDAQHCSELIEEFDGDAGFLEMRAAKVKTANTVQKRIRLLPMVAPACGLSGRSWARRWMAVRSMLGHDVSRDGCLQLAPISGGWSDRKITSSETSLWMRDILIQRGMDESTAVAYSSHSCKTTLLSFAAKAGLLPETRRILGYHVDRNSVSMFTYGRDNMAAPLRDMESVIEAIRQGTFLPDRTRSGHWVEESFAVSICVPDILQSSSSHDLGLDVGPPVDVSAGEVDDEPDGAEPEHWSSSGSDSSGQDAMEAELAMESEFVDDLDFWLHAGLGTIHIMGNLSTGTFVCGRVKHSQHVAVSEKDSTGFHVCLQCRPLQ